MPPTPSSPLPGLHHVTAICGDPRRNVAFYTGVLGLRLIKKTVNFDDPGTYHLYYADGVGTPGSVLTFFPFAGARVGRPGTGVTSTTAYAIPTASLDWWAARLQAAGVTVRETAPRFGSEHFLSFADPDGLELEFVATDAPSVFVPWADSPVPTEHQLQGFHSVTLVESAAAPTEEVLVAHLGWRLLAQDGVRRRYVSPTGGPASMVDLIVDPTLPREQSGRGSVHHIAFRVADDEAEKAWREHLVESGHAISPVIDRNYFHSLYFREPGGVLFEIATDTPGFAIDEPIASLGQRLMLPPQYEPHRERIEAHLPPLAAATP